MALAVRGDDRSAPLPPIAPPSSTAVPGLAPLQRIPADFDLTVQPATSGYAARDSSAVDDLSLCGSTVFATGPDAVVPVVDSAVASFSQDGTEAASGRTLVLYADEDAARRSVAAIEEGVRACPVERRDPGTPLVHDRVGAELPTDQSLVFTQQARMGGGLLADLTVYQVARVGNAVYLATAITSAGGPQVVDREVRRTAELSGPVLSDMCVFAADPCSRRSEAAAASASAGTSPGTDPAADRVIPAGFPLLDGYPADASAESRQDGRSGPSRSIVAMEPTACGRTLTVPEHVDLLRAGWQNPEDQRQRQLVVFAGAAQASAYAASVLDLSRSCPTEKGADGYTAVTSVVGTVLGDEGGVAVTRWEVDGAPAIGLAVTHVSRTRRAVLLAATYNEGSAPTDQAVLDAADEAGRQLTGVVPAMCVFTEQGC